MNVEAFFVPHFSSASETVLRGGYALLLLFQLALTAPQAVRFFCSERYGGYVEQSAFADAFQRPSIIWFVFALWVLAAVGLFTNTWTLAAASVNVVFARYFFVNTRWKSILRGMGAPGHMNYWLATLTFFLALSGVFDVNSTLRTATVFVFRVDLGLIMISAGIYKMTAGYTKNEGMERGLVNPWWGFWAPLYNRLPPRDPVFRILNHLAYLTEIVCGALMLITPLSVWGALGLGLSFIFIGLNIRLGFLAEMVTVCCLLYVNAGDFADRFFSRYIYAEPAIPHSAGAGAFVALAAAYLLYAYALALLPAYVGMYVNFYGRRRLSESLQRMLDWFTRTFGLMIWRVFTIDVTNFYAVVRLKDVRTGAQRPYLQMKAFDRRSGFRYMHVGEFICLASIFTTMKYYPDDVALFEKRLVRYARTVPINEDEAVVFEYIAIEKLDKYEHRVVRRYECDPRTGQVCEEVVDQNFDVRSGAPVSPVHPNARPGSYAPHAAGP